MNVTSCASDVVRHRAAAGRHVISLTSIVRKHEQARELFGSPMAEQV